jgi:hypothetical protein
MASLTAFALGMLTLSICFIVTTYLMLAIAVAFTRMARRASLVAPKPLRMDLRLIACFGAAGVCFLLGINMFIRFLA